MLLFIIRSISSKTLKEKGNAYREGRKRMMKETEKE